MISTTTASLPISALIWSPKWEHFLALSALRGIPVYHVKQFNESITGRVAVDHLRENTLGAVVPSLIYPQFKRVFDFLAALLFLPFVASMLGVCAILIKLETPGPIFYRQRRAGFGGRPFTIFKLRTMTHNHGGGDYTLRRRQADYSGGRILAPVSYRRAAANHQYSARGHELDRPSPGGDVARANGMSVKCHSTSIATSYEPGITGWAQVHQGNVAAVDAARLKLEYDFFYIKHFSFWLDAVIVMKTLRTIVTGFGSR